MVRDFNGQEAVEFILISVLVFFGAIFTITVFGDKLSGFFTSGSSVVSSSKSSKNLLTSQSAMTFKPDYETTADIPIKDTQDLSSDEISNAEIVCTGDDCSLKLGDITLKNLPDNFNEYIKTAGSSGGTKTVSDLLNQYASGLEIKDLPPETIDSVKNLANLGHSMANYQQSIETKIKNCNGNSTCEKSAASNIDRSIINVGEAIRASMYDTKTFEKNLSNRVAYQFVDEMNKINNDPNLSQSDINVIKELVWDIGVIGEDFQNNAAVITGTKGNAFYDPLTGEESWNEVKTNATENFLNYGASKITHFDSALICASNKNEDSGTQCHQP